jgi:hypothetical protein
MFRLASWNSALTRSENARRVSHSARDSIRLSRPWRGKTAHEWRCGNLGFNWNRSEIPMTNNGLKEGFRRSCVLFVQHPATNARFDGFPSGSFVACAEVLGNCERATEGGIPRSSRFRWFALVPRVHAGVSEGAKRLSGEFKGQGNQP